MKLLIKIIILCILIFGLSVYVAKKSIDYTFEQVESSHTTDITKMYFQLTADQT